MIGHAAELVWVDLVNAWPLYAAGLALVGFALCCLMSDA